MNNAKTRHHTMLASAIGAVLLFGFLAQASAQRGMDRREQSSTRGAEQAETQYPNASRESPKPKTGRAGRKLQQMLDLHEEDKATDARAIADQVIADSSATDYERAFAAQFGAQLAYEADDSTAAIDYLNQAIAIGGLGNDAHFASLLLLTQLQAQEEQFPQALATLDRLMQESGAQTYEQLLHKGRVLNRMERFQEAVTTLKQAQAAAPDDKTDWQSELMYAYAETDQTAETAKLAEAIAAKNPTDKRSQLNLAATYQQADMLDKSAEILERLRRSGQLTEEREYRQLYSTYLNLEGREKEAATVINDGLEKGLLKPDFEVYLALAQSYYFSEQLQPAIDAYRKAAPLDKDGDTYLNLARLLWQEDRIDEAKDAARQAITKGLEDPSDAQKILAL